MKYPQSTRARKRREAPVVRPKAGLAADGAKQFSALYRLMAEWRDCRTETDILQKTVRAAMRLLKSDVGFAYGPSSGDNSPNLAYSSPHTTNAHSLLAQHPRLRHALHMSRPSFQEIAPGGGNGVRSLLVLPLTYGNRSFGGILLGFTRTRWSGATWPQGFCNSLAAAAAQALALFRLAAKPSAGDDRDERREKNGRKLKESNRRLQREKAKDKALVVSLGEGVLATDEAGSIILINPEAQSILGIQEKKAVNRSAYNIQKFVNSQGQAVPLENHPLHIALSGGNRVHLDGNADLNIKKGKMHMLPVAVTATPIKVGRRVVGAVEIFWDVSKEKEIDRVKSELISLASHQLRTPLSAINWYAEVLIKGELGALNPEQLHYLEEIYHANKKMVELVYDFLNVSRMELGTFTIKLSELKIHELAESIMRELRPSIKEKLLQVTENYSPALPVLFADRKIVKIILQNLLSNAVKYTPAKGAIQVSIQLTGMTPDSGRLVIEVSDNGYGIPKRQQAKIFTKLFRADNAARLETEGTGLGLYIVKSFVDFCHGAIWFKSVENKGSTFHVELPVDLAPAAKKNKTE